MPLLVRVPNWLGDVMMCLPQLNGLIGRFPDTSIWGHERVSDLLAMIFPDTRIIDLDEKPSGFDRILLMTDSFSSAFLAWRAGIPERIGYRAEGRTFFLTSHLARNRRRDHHHTEDYSALSRILGADPEPPDLSDIDPEGTPHVALFPGARYGSAKMWQGYADLAGKLVCCTGLPVVLYGTAGERELLMRVAMSLSDIDIEAGLPLPGLCRRLRSAVLSVGNDSGGVHLSAGLGVPTVTIFGSTTPVWTAPLGQHTANVYLDRFCSPCFRKRCPGGDQPPCLQDITTTMVVNACLELMDDQ
jgi:heptosyltransferase-2